MLKIDRAGWPKSQQNNTTSIIKTHMTYNKSSIDNSSETERAGKRLKETETTIAYMK